MDWLSDQLQTWWVVLPICWSVGVITFACGPKAGIDFQDYFQSLKEVVALTILFTVMDAILFFVPAVFILYFVRLLFK
jgi:hypothetical protein